MTTKMWNAKHATLAQTEIYLWGVLIMRDNPKYLIDKILITSQV
jgi:hypothetical protein